MSDPDDTGLDPGLEVLRMYARGMTGTEIGAVLHIAPGSVRSRMKRLYRHLGARSIAQAVVIAGIEGLLTREDLRVAYEDRRIAGEGEE